MTTEDIKRMVDDERAEQLTAQLCRHWEVASARLETLVEDMESDMEICVEAEIYAAMMRMQSAVMALMELNKIPTAFLFSEYIDRIAKSVSDTSIRQSVVKLLERLIGDNQRKQPSSFFDLLSQTLSQHFALSPDDQKAIQEKASPLQYTFSVFAQYLQPNDLMMVASVIQNINAEAPMSQEETTDHLKLMRQAMDGLAEKMNESLQLMLIWLLLLMLMPGLIVQLMQEKRGESEGMASLFNKVLVRVRESNAWFNYWNEHRETLRVVSDDCSWKDIMTEERSKERTELGKVPGGLFAKYTTDEEAFEADFLEAHLSDDALRSFIFHLASLSEIARELDPTTKFGQEQLVNNELQRVGEAVLSAAAKLHDLVDNKWFPHYEAMWQELVQNETIFSHLKITRQSPHNNLFTARFFCHLVGEMKKNAVFGSHSDRDLAMKLTETRYVDTYRKNIQEGMGNEDILTQNIFKSIYQKHNDLAHQKQ